MSATLSEERSENRAWTKTRGGGPWPRAIASADGTFVYSVRSTGVYCRPSCPARPAKPVQCAVPRDPRGRRARWVPAVQALQAGSAGAARSAATKVAEICRFIEAADHVPSLDELARSAQA